MRIHAFSRQPSGYALLFTIVFLAVMLVVFASMMSWVSAESGIVQRNNQYTMSQAAAEAANERVLAVMMRDFTGQCLTNASFYASLALTPASETNYDGSPWPVQYLISDINGVANQITVLTGQVQSVMQPVSSQYANLMGYPQYWTNIATATPIGQPYTIPVTVTQVINFCNVPLFQYAIFYNLNLEIDPGKPMFVNGPVWSNQGLWAGAGGLTFNSTVSAVSNSYTISADPFCSNKVDSSAPPTFLVTGQPSSGNTPLVMPIAGATNANPTNVEAMLNIPPAAYAMGTANAYSTNGQVYMANCADLIISNASYGVNWGNTNYTITQNCTNNITIWYQDTSNGTNLLRLTPNLYIFNASFQPPTGLFTNYVSPNKSDTTRCYTNVVYAGWSFLTNSIFYDYREKAWVQAVTLNVSNFANWLNDPSVNGGSNINAQCQLLTHKKRAIAGIWIYNSVAPVAGSTLPGVRVANGIQLPTVKGLTVATPMPLYVWGDYNKQIDSTHVSVGTNTTYTYPAALMGDAITILSSSWSDTYNTSTTLSSRAPVATTVNAACLEGIVQSINGNYSGGVENFLRYLEDWNAITNTYNGSIVVMFPSIYATNLWGNTTYYSVPSRAWGFDYNFTDPTKLPPMTPQLKKTIRVSWAAN